VDKLKEKIDATFPSRAAFAEAIGVDPSTLSRMLNSGNWKADRIEVAVKVLKIKPADIPLYFFTPAVANKTTQKT